MKRREFITLVGGAAAAWPLVARAQQSAMPVIGFLSPASLELYADRVRAFQQGLGETGFAEGRNVAIEYRWAEGHNERLPMLAADLVRSQVTVITAAGIPAVQAARAATATIPIVFQGGFDPVALGFVASLSRPGGNITGASSLAIEVGPKRLELLHELVPAAKIVGLLVNPTNPSSEIQSKDLQAAARALGLQLHVVHARVEGELDAVFATLAQLRASALVIGNDGFLISQAKTLGALTSRHAVPAIFQFRDFAAAGGLMSYGSDFTPYRLAGNYTGRILKGEKPADLPVQQSTKVELIINLKTAKALGITFPLPLLGRADEVIE